MPQPLLVFPLPRCAQKRILVVPQKPHPSPVAKRSSNEVSRLDVVIRPRFLNRKRARRIVLQSTLWTIGQNVTAPIVAAFALYPPPKQHAPIPYAVPS